MTDKELEQQKNVYRVGCNLQVLLDIGLFPGKHSLGVEECKGFVNAFVAEAKRNIEPKVEPPPAAPITPELAK